MNDVLGAIMGGVVYTCVGILMLVCGLLALAFLPIKLMIKRGKDGKRNR